MEILSLDKNVPGETLDFSLCSQKCLHGRHSVLLPGRGNNTSSREPCISFLLLCKHITTSLVAVGRNPGSVPSSA